MSSATVHPAELAVVAFDQAHFAPPAAPDDDEDKLSTRTHEEGKPYEGHQVRQGTITSARFQILSTMIGGGFLSLPLAFQQSGSFLLGPLMLITVAFISDFCFRLLVASANHLSPPHKDRPGKHSFESIASAAFGPRAYVLSMALVVFTCFSMAVGYCVLLRDMVEPITDLIPLQYIPSNWLHKNLILFTIMVFVTPLNTLRSFTGLKSYSGAASMMSIFILGSCIVFRSIQCNIDAPDPFYKHLTFFPEDPRNLLDSAPIYISSFICHFNILPVHNELQQPTPKRVSWWLRSTTWFAALFYLIIGFAGSAYGNCTETGRVQGNILLDFDKDDPLLLVGRMCLALSITMTFPTVVIPARDIVLQSILLPCLESAAASVEDVTMTEALEETLEEGGCENASSESTASTEQSSTAATDPATASFLLRLLTAIGIFWTAGGVASGVESIDIVWELLGSSLSVLLCYLIPCGTYLAITKDREGHVASKWLAWLLILVFTPFMFLSTTNAVDNAFF